jgi:glycosyltransferase involved in cell wall biosynthesis
MKVLIVNNYLSNTLGGVENYLQALTQYAQNNETEIEFKWFGVADKKTKWYQKFYNAATTTAIIAEIDTFKPDLIHSFSIGATVTPHFMSYAKSKNIPIIHSFHDYYYICPKGYMLDISENSLSKKHNFINCILHHHPKKTILFDGILNLKQSYHKSIIKKNISYFLSPSTNLSEMIGLEFEKKGATLPNPVVISNPDVDTQKSDYLLFVGRLEVEKGVLTLVKAFQQLLQNFPNEQLKIVGSGSFQSEIEKYIEKNKIKNIAFLGAKSCDELIEIYASAKITIVPSEILESYGNVILESFAFGKTVVISDLLGIQKEVAGTKSGLIFPYGNVEKLQEAIEKLLSNSALRRELEQNATHFVSHFSFENHLEALHNIYKKVLKNEF